MRAAFSFVLVWLVGCGAKPSPAPPEPFRASDAAATFAAYQEYCGLCPDAETCCLGEAEFAASHWSSTSGRYLRAMRDYYHCQRAATLGGQEPSRPAPSGPLDSFGPLSGANVRASCYPHSCGDFSELMVAELDGALAKPAPHIEGALVVCSASESGPIAAAD